MGTNHYHNTSVYWPRSYFIYFRIDLVLFIGRCHDEGLNLVLVFRDQLREKVSAQKVLLRTNEDQKEVQMWVYI